VRHPLKVFATVFLLLCAVMASGQSSQQSSVLIRNVRVADGEGSPLVVADVLVSGGRISRMGAGSPAPAGAIVIDGGGNRLTPGADGQIRLTPVTTGIKAASYWFPSVSSLTTSPASAISPCVSSLARNTTSGTNRARASGRSQPASR
jgi:hypothetical protein